MDSPSKNDKLIQEEVLEQGQDGMPQEIWDDIQKNEKFIYYALMFCNGSVLWAYYSCLSAQNFYEVQFPNSGLNFSFLTTLTTSWPMVGGVFLQMFFGLDKQLSQSLRVHVGFVIFGCMAILIMVFSGINFSSDKTGATLVLVCFGCIGFGNSLSEATFYTLAALFPVAKFTNAVQIGNVCAGVINITLATLLRLAIGGVHQTGDSTKTSFYVFFSILVLVLIAAIIVYRKLIALPSVAFLLARNDEATKTHNLVRETIIQRLANFWRIFKIIWVPACAQFLVLFVSLSVFPGFACTAARNYMGPPYSDEVHPTTNLWYCSPGIVGGYDFGDFFGRIICTAAVYKIFTMNIALSLTVLRIAYIPLTLMGVAGTSLYAFGYNSTVWSLVYNVILTFTIGLSNGLLSTVTMGVAPRLLKPDDRETGGALMVLCLFAGIAGGSTFAYYVTKDGYFGL